MEQVIGYCTFPNAAQAKEISTLMVSEGLVACANIFAPMTSVYAWEGRLESNEEIPVFFKTTRRKFKTLKGRIKALHPYSNPCLVALPVVDGLPEFLNWISNQTL